MMSQKIESDDLIYKDFEQFAIQKFKNHNPPQSVPNQYVS